MSGPSRRRHARAGLPQAGRGDVVPGGRRADGPAALDGGPARSGGPGPAGETVSRAMTVPREGPDKLAVKLLAGDLTPEEAAALRREVEADPDGRAALGRLEEVIGALRTWCQS